MNENTFKERLKLFFIKNQRSSECSWHGRAQPCPSRVPRDAEPLPSAGGPVPACPQPGAAAASWLLFGGRPARFGGPCMGRRGWLLPPLLPGDSYSVTSSCDKLAGSRVGVREPMSPSRSWLCLPEAVGTARAGCELPSPAPAIGVSLHLTNGVFIFFL